MIEEKDGDILDPKTNPMIRLPDVDPAEGGEEPMPFMDTGPEDDEVASAVRVFLGEGTESIEILAAPGLPLSRFDGQIELNGKPLEKAGISERRALVDAARAKQKDAAEAMTVEDAMNSKTNPFIRSVPLDD